jgi:branched-chain amino acid transport system substrate-binding protein
LGAQITRLKQQLPNVDFVYLCASGAPGISAIRQIRAAGINAPIFTDGPFDGDWWRNAVPNLSNFYYTTWFSMYGDDDDPKVNAFFERYKKRYGELPNVPMNVFGYAAVQMWADAVRRAGTFDGDSVRRQLDKMQSASTLAGPTTFTEDVHYGVTGRGMVIYEVENWVRHRAGRFNPAVPVKIVL